MNAQIVHVNFQPLFCDHVGKDMVHKGLEDGWSVTKSKEHDGWLKEAEVSDKCALPLVFFLDTDIVEPHLTSNLVTNVESFMSSISSGMRGNGYVLWAVWEFKYL